MRIAVCGHGRAGKDTVSEWLRDNTGLRYTGSTSQAAARVVMSNMNAAGHAYASVEECWNDRHNHRTEWRDIIWAYNGPDGMALYRDMAAENDILNGIRSIKELAACKRSGLIDAAVWVSAPVPIDLSNEIRPNHCQYVIKNCGSTPDLYRELKSFVMELRDEGWPVLVKESCLRQ